LIHFFKRGLETDCVVVGGEPQDGVGGLVR